MHVCDGLLLVSISILLALTLGHLIALKTRIRRALVIKIWLDDIVFSIQVLITDNLNGCPVLFLLHYEHGHALRFTLSKIDLQHDVVNIFINTIHYPDIINFSIFVQVKVIDLILFIVQFTFKDFQGFTLLKKLQRCIQVEVIARKAEAFFLILLSSYPERGSEPYKCQQ